MMRDQELGKGEKKLYGVEPGKWSRAVVFGKTEDYYSVPQGIFDILATPSRRPRIAPAKGRS
jgi:hypothetical protein